MSDATKIEWADATWNPMTGCTPVSEACEHCYAERMARRFAKVTPSEGTTMVEACSTPGGGPVPFGFTPTFYPHRLDIPLHWTRKPRRVFVCSMSDLFHEAFTDEQRDAVFSAMVAAPQHTYMVLTKRPERMREYMLGCQRGADDIGERFPWPHVWLGVTVENQQRADERIPILLDTPAAVRFVSAEPTLGPVDLTGYVCGHDCEDFGLCNLDGLTQRERAAECAYPRLNWVILGGETGPGARPMQPEWALDVWRQCKAAGVAFFWKQEGSASAIPPHKPYTKMIATREFPAVTR